MASSAETIPSALLHNIKHNQVLHERVVILTVQIEEVPHYPPEKRSEVVRNGEGFNRVRVRNVQAMALGGVPRISQLPVRGL